MSELVNKFTNIVFNEASPAPELTKADIDAADKSTHFKINIGILVDLQKYSSKDELVKMATACAHALTKIQTLTSDMALKQELMQLLNIPTPKNMAIIPKLFIVENTTALYQTVSALDFINNVIAKMDPHNLLTTRYMNPTITTSYYSQVNPCDFTVHIKNQRDANYSQVPYNIYINTLSDPEHIVFNTRVPNDCPTIVINEPAIDSRANNTHARKISQMVQRACLQEVFFLRKSCDLKDIKTINKNFEDKAALIKVEADSASNDAVVINDKKEINLDVRHNIDALSFLITNSTDNNTVLSASARNQIKDLNKDFQKNHPFLSGKYFSIKNGVNFDLIKTDLMKLANNEEQSLANAWIAMFPGANAPFADFAKDAAERRAKELDIKQKDMTNFKYIKAPHFAELYKEFFGEELKLK